MEPTNSAKSEDSQTMDKNSMPTPPPFKGKKKIGKRTLIMIIAGSVLIAAGGVWGLIYYLQNRSFHLTPNTVVFESDGGTARVKVEGPHNWQILNTPKAWSSVYRDGDYLCYAVGENESYTRKDSIKIGNGRKSAYFIVTQESGAFYADPTHAIIANGGDTKSFHIYGQNDWHIETGPQGWGNAYRSGESLMWSVNENHGEEREDFIELRSGNKTLTIAITQTAALRAESMSVNFSSSGGTKRIKIYGPDNWSCRTNEYWLDVEQEGDCLKVECDKNDDDYSREGTISVSGGGQTIEISVTQSKKTTSYYNGWGWYY